MKTEMDRSTKNNLNMPANMRKLVKLQITLD